MESHNEEQAGATRLLHAQTHVWNHIFSFINSMSLKSAIDLNIPDIIHKHGKPMPLPQLVSSLQIHPSKTPNIHRLMRLLTQTGFFSLQKVPETDPLEEGYVLTDASTLLLKDNPFSVTPLLHSMLDPLLTKPWYELATWFQNKDSTPFETTHGKAFWEYAWREPRLYNYFNELLTSDSRLVTSVVLEKCKEVFEGLGSLVDVGGGTGTMAKALAEAFPEMECVVFDQPYVINIGGMKGSGNLKFVEGDMFQAIPPADAILLKGKLKSE